MFFWVMGPPRPSQPLVLGLTFAYTRVLASCRHVQAPACDLSSVASPVASWPLAIAVNLLSEFWEGSKLRWHQIRLCGILSV